jgi:hypothetical protein
LRLTVNDNFYATYSFILTGRAFYPKGSPKSKKKNRFCAVSIHTVAGGPPPSFVPIDDSA